MARTMAASSSTVDLSRLPAPTIVEQLDFATIRDRMLAKLVAIDPTFTALVPADPAYKVIEVAAYEELILRAEFNDRARQLLVAFATGTNLDHLASLVAVERLVVTPADPVTGAAALLEADDDLRQRVVLAPEQLSVAGPELAYGSPSGSLKVSTTKRVPVSSIMRPASIAPGPLGLMTVSAMNQLGCASLSSAASPSSVGLIALS